MIMTRNPRDPIEMHCAEMNRKLHNKCPTSCVFYIKTCYCGLYETEKGMPKRCNICELHYTPDQMLELLILLKQIRHGELI